MTLYSVSFCQTPTIAASNIVFSNVGCNEFTVSCTKGNGMERVIFVREGSAFTDVPQKNEFYTDYPVFKKGGSESIKNDNTHFCVYRGNGNSVTVSGLKKNTKYYVAIFEYNAPGGGVYDYLTSSYPSENVISKGIIADFSLTDTSQCFNGNSFKFINKSTSDRSPMTYSWFFGDANTSTSTDPVHSYASPNIYKVKLIVNSPGCTDTIIKKSHVHPHPVTKFVLDPLKPKNDSIQCFFGNRFTFKNLSTLVDIGDPNSSMSYEWKMDNGYTQTGFKADRSFPQPGVFTINLVATSFYGCKDSTYRFYKVLPRAIDTSQVIYNAHSMCLSNNKFVFTNNSSNSINNSWRYREEFASKDLDSTFGITANYTFKKTGKYYVTLRAYDLGGCLDQLRDSVEVYSNTNVSFTGLAPWYCLNDKDAILKPQPGKGIFIGTNVNPTDSSFSPKSTGIFNIGYVFSKGSCRDTVWNKTEVFNRPIINIGRDTVICNSSPLQLNVDPKYTTTWKGPSMTVNGSFINVDKSGTYTVRSVDGNCDAFDTIVIKALANPKLPPMVDTTLCGGSFLKFELKVEMGNVWWNDGNNDNERVLNKSGFYKVTLSNKCGSVSDSLNLNVEETACVIFFPNSFSPNDDQLNDIWKPFGKYEFIRMTIFNRWGEKVYFSDKSPEWNGYNEKNLCLSGMYKCIFEYLIQDGNSMKKESKGIQIYLVK
ncbi:MAG: gliding motility-associated C-terminal domain-containing protein [Bacteroidetes bacterium]|nr:gliding motility-associated C-terminal domain-containing protein [Bacteroidota bacterium]